MIGSRQCLAAALVVSIPVGLNCHSAIVNQFGRYRLYYVTYVTIALNMQRPDQLAGVIYLAKVHKVTYLIIT